MSLCKQNSILFIRDTSLLNLFNLSFDMKNKYFIDIKIIKNNDPLKISKIIIVEYKFNTFKIIINTIVKYNHIMNNLSINFISLYN